MKESPIVVAVVNTNPPLIERLRIALEDTGFVTFVLHIESIKLGESEIDAFLEQHKPSVIVYDIAPPFEQNFRFLQHLRTATGLKKLQFVLTSMNATRLLERIDLEENVYEVLGEPADINEVVRAVKEAARVRDIK